MAAKENSGPPDRPHIRIDAFLSKAAYTYPSRKQERKPLRDNYASHAAHLLKRLDAALGIIPPKSSDKRISLSGFSKGTIVEITTMVPLTSRRQAVKLPTNFEFPAQNLIILHSKRNDNRTESALFFIPDNARPYLQAKIEEYGTDPANGDRSDIQRFEAIEEFNEFDVRSLFIGTVDLSDPKKIWWEIWIRQNTNLADQIAQIASARGLDVHENRLFFPDTTILFLHTSSAALAEFALCIPGAITEIRATTGTIEPFLKNTGSGVKPDDWVQELAKRVSPPAKNAPVVCTLDTGINSSHPLIAPGLRGAWSYDAAWGADDHAPHGGHGTALTGLVLYGDLEPLVSDSRKVTLTHGAESMKLLPPKGFPPTQPPSYGVVTQGAISLVESERPNVLRSFCIANSTSDNPPHRPSTWSGAIDQAIAGAMMVESEGKTSAAKRPKRLIVIATGNVIGGQMPDVMPIQPLEDPSQSWNALTIGGFTRKEQAPPGNSGRQLRPLVSANNRSPYSRGTQSLPTDLTPIKPEVLFEAGNMLVDSSEYCGWHPSVSLLAPGSNVQTEPLVPFWATSAAAGMAGNFIGQLQSAHPIFWPETHRALTVDSARWPAPIRKQFIGTGAHWKTGSKAEKQSKLREYGYGVPDIERALFSAKNDATLIAESEIQPFTVGGDGKSGVFNELHFYNLPWPRGVLEQLENKVVTMKVTLSYFIEPNLSGKAATRPDTYRSYGLRFEMKKRGESDARFLSRIGASQEKRDSEVNDEASYWLLGSKGIQAGSLHCDLWRGTAIDLAGHDSIAIYPVGGWWKSHIGQKRMQDKARYSLVISISAPEQDVDLYSEIVSLVEAKNIEAQISR